jgi:hypothetical protein
MMVVLDLSFAKQTDDIKVAIVVQFIAQNSRNGELNCIADSFFNAFPFSETTVMNILSALKNGTVLDYSRKRGRLSVRLAPEDKWSSKLIQISGLTGSLDETSSENPESCILVLTEFLEAKKIQTKKDKTSSKNVVKTNTLKDLKDERQAATVQRTRDVGNYFSLVHKKIYGLPAKIEYGRDKGLLNRLPAEYTADLLRPTIDAFFRSDSWEKKNIGPTIPAWIRCIPKLLKPLSSTNQSKRLKIPGITE